MSKLVLIAMLLAVMVTVYGLPAATDSNCKCGDVLGDFCDFRATDGTGYLKGCPREGSLYECKVKGGDAVFLTDCNGWCVSDLDGGIGVDGCH